MVGSWQNIDPRVVQSPEAYFQWMREQIGSSQSNIVAGTNITISGDGSVNNPYVINSTGGGGTGTVTSVAASAGTGISISGSPITTSGTITITNSAPDQIVALSSSGLVNITGTYPNFTIAATINGIDVTTALGFTPENVSNKSTDVTLGTSDTLYPTQNAVKTYVDTNSGASSNNPLMVQIFS